MAESPLGTILWLVFHLAQVIALSAISYRIGRRGLAFLPLGVTVVYGLFAGYFLGWYNGEPSVQYGLAAFASGFAHAALIAACITSVTLAVLGPRSSVAPASLEEAI